MGFIRSPEPCPFILAEIASKNAVPACRIHPDGSPSSGIRSRARCGYPGEKWFFTVSSTATKCLVAYGLRPSAIRRRSRKGHPSQPRRPSGWLGAHAWTPPSRPPIQERGPRRRPPQNLEIERAADRNTPIFIGLQLLQEPLMCVLKSTKSPKNAAMLVSGANKPIQASFPDRGSNLLSGSNLNKRRFPYRWAGSGRSFC